VALAGSLASALGSALAASATAAPLTALAPASTLLAVHVAPLGASYPALSDTLAGLDAAGAAATLSDALRTFQSAVSAPSAHDPEAARALAAAARALQGRSLDDALVSACPGLGRAPLPGVREALFVVSATPYAPVPAVLVLARVAPGAGPATDDAIAALDHCYASGVAQTQDGVSLRELALGDATIAVARIGDVVAAASTIDLLRAAVRLAHGSTEPSLASRVPGALAALNGAGITVSLDNAAVAGVLGALPGLPSDPTAHAARVHLQDALRTVPLIALQLTAEPSGLVLQSWARVDPNGGDGALATLLRCDGCRARPSLLVPADALAVAASPLRLQAWTTYLAGLAGDVAAAGGGRIDPLALLKQQTGLDLANDLFPWLGTVATTVELPAPAGTPQALLGVPAQLTIVPVASPERAGAGLARLGPALKRLLARLSGTGGGAIEAAGLDPSALVAARSERYRDVAITRIQVGPSADLGVALVGSRLVLASPSVALRSVIDTYRGGPTLHASALAAALATAPAGSQAVWASDGAAMLHGVASILRALSQPTAFALQTGLVAARRAAAPGNAGPGASPPSPQPDLGRLLDATELPADTLDAVAAHLGVTRGWSVWRDGMLVRRWSLPIH